MKIAIILGVLLIGCSQPAAMHCTSGFKSPPYTRAWMSGGAVKWSDFGRISMYKLRAGETCYEM